MGRRHSSRRPRPDDRSAAARRNGGRDSGLPGSRWWTSHRVCALAVCGLLLLGVGLVFGQTAGFGFVNYDDNAGVYDNRLVTGELTLRGVLAVFTQRHVESWAPLTCLSHILVWHLLGHGAAAHHLTNVLMHAASAVLLFLVLWRMTGHLWPSALVAAIFAVHPLRAESVAWVTERKDVLSGLFFMLTLAAYLGYVRGGKGDRHLLPERPVGCFAQKVPAPFSLRYLTVLACFIVGLAAKPMAVTLPFLLLLLDYWPLGRMNGTKPRSSIAPSTGQSTIASGAAVKFSVATKARSTMATSPARSTIAALWRLILEKIPMLVIAALFCLVAVRFQRTGRLNISRQYSLAWRIGNALVSYVAYLGQFFCPQGLVPCYPRRPVPLPLWQVAAAVSDARGDHGGGDPLKPAAAVPAGRLALIPRDAGAGDRAGAVWHPRRSRSLHLPATDRADDRVGLDRGGRLSGCAAISPDLGRRRHGAAC